MSAVSAAATYANNRSQIKKQDAILSQQLLRSNARQKRADQEVKALVDRTAQSSMQDEKAGRLSEYLGQLSQALPASQGGLRNVPNASSAFQKDSEAAALGIAKAGNTYADRVSTIDAAGLQRQGENIDARRTATQPLSLLEREQQGDNRTTDIRLRGVRSNPWLTALAQVAGSFGSGYSGGGGGGAASAAGAFQPSNAAVADAALGSMWGRPNSLVFGNYSGLRG